MAFPPKKVLIIGATSGIGQSLAAKFAKAGSSVIVTGRRQERLQEFVQNHKDAAKPVTSYPFDMNKIEDIPKFAQNVSSENPDIDCLLINSGMQRALDFSKPESVDWSMFEEELRVNYVGHVALALAFLPIFQKSSEKKTMIFMSSGLALTPLPRTPGYSAAKAAAHHFVLSLRHQLKGSNVGITEIIPPMVATELHDKQGPDGRYGRKFGMPLDKFTEDAWAGLEAGKDQIPVGMTVANFEGFEVKRQEGMDKMAMGVQNMLKQL